MVRIITDSASDFEPQEFDKDQVNKTVAEAGYSDTIDDVACQSPILISLDDSDLLESTNVMDVVAYLVYSCLLGIILGTV